MATKTHIYPKTFYPLQAVYRKIFELIPCLEFHPEWCFDECWGDVEDCNIEEDEAWLNRKKKLHEQWLEENYVPKMTIKNQSGGKDLSEKILFSLVDILSAYGDQIKDYQKHGIPITDEDLKEIDKL